MSDSNELGEGSNAPRVKVPRKPRQTDANRGTYAMGKPEVTGAKLTLYVQQLSPSVSTGYAVYC